VMRRHAGESAACGMVSSRYRLREWYAIGLHGRTILERAMTILCVCDHADFHHVAAPDVADDRSPHCRVPVSRRRPARRPAPCLALAHNKC
jgi:hypothetical protein